jgi:arsenite methyltransferase
MKNKKTIKKVVKESYGNIASGKTNSCGCNCSNQHSEFAESIGYSKEELKVIPKDANLSLSCGNPTAFADLKKGEVVLDLGSGAGMDCFLASSKVGENGKVIGLDMTPEMIKKAKQNALKNGIKNVEFKQGDIEDMPIENNSIDVIISNCVINLATDKNKVFKEIYRVLKPGGRISISDIALLKPLPDTTRKSIEAYVGCVAGAILVDDYKNIAEESGLNNVKIRIKGSSSCIKPDTQDPMGKTMLKSLGEKQSLENYIVSVIIEGIK